MTNTYLTFEEGMARYEEIGWAKQGEEGRMIPGPAYLDSSVNHQKLANAIHSNIRTMEFGNAEWANEFFTQMADTYAEIFIAFAKKEILVILCTGNLLCPEKYHDIVKEILDMAYNEVNTRCYNERNMN